jgi:hypothetical protein
MGRGVEAAAVAGTRRPPLPLAVRSTTGVTSSHFGREIHGGREIR